MVQIGLKIKVFDKTITNEVFGSKKNEEKGKVLYIERNRAGKAYFKQ